jgi:FAD:protein FMN transferase
MVFGTKSTKSPLNIGFENPRKKAESEDLIALIKLRCKAISTFEDYEDYERYFIVDGKRFHHSLKVKMGCPATYCCSLTIITERGALTDGFSTAVFVFGPEKGIDLVQKVGMDTVRIENNGKICTTPGVKGILTVEENH